MNKDMRKLHESFQHALRGLQLCCRHERNFRVHITAAFYVTLFAIWGQAALTDCAVLLVCFGLTMGAELMNTAIERLCDKQATGYDKTVRDAKDIAAGAVFVCALSCAFVGVTLFLGHGLIGTALAYLQTHPVSLGALLISVPAFYLFIFRFGRIQ